MEIGDFSLKKRVPWTFVHQVIFILTLKNQHLNPNAQIKQLLSLRHHQWGFQLIAGK